ncbi:hypothetical protein BGZ60DRAFT_522012 [Tricladium varicosporioides]|nr:hypothetical protein BGZ60DRAFT_522012 [Hymenoscyphus varicosporioides]
MAPLTPSWAQPSHPEIQEVLLTNPNEFTTKSISRITLPPFALFAKMAFPPCTHAEKATYATVQMGRSEHLNLNSDLVYINHSCVPSVIFDTSSLSILAGPNGLRTGEELTFFYPSTEWDMAQGFDCFCGHATCKGKITGAKDMPAEKLEGYFLNAHIRNMLEERDGVTKVEENAAQNGHENDHGKSVQNGVQKIANSINGTHTPTDDVEAALLMSLLAAVEMVSSAKKTLDIYRATKIGTTMNSKNANDAANGAQAVVADAGGAMVEGEKRRGVTSREMSGEMGGDTLVVV